ncbi:MAG: hypothetical protein PHG55_02995 [Verrucomicrobiota bacterium]|nr:hypothetical protein [Verrucomicrobiota bacterium]
MGFRHGTPGTATVLLQGGHNSAVMFERSSEDQVPTRTGIDPDFDFDSDNDRTDRQPLPGGDA